MEQPDKLAPGQVWKDEGGNLYIIHGSPTGKNLRALNLTNFIAREWTFGVPSWVEFVTVLNGKELL